MIVGLSYRQPSSAQFGDGGKHQIWMVWLIRSSSWMSNTSWTWRQRLIESSLKISKNTMNIGGKSYYIIFKDVRNLESTKKTMLTKWCFFGDFNICVLYIPQLQYWSLGNLSLPPRSATRNANQSVSTSWCEFRSPHEAGHIATKNY